MYLCTFINLSIHVFAEWLYAQTQYAFLTRVHARVFSHSDMASGWMDKVSYSYFIRECGKLRVSTLAWEEPALEADQVTHLQTQLMCVWGCLCVCTCTCVCIKSSVCIRARTTTVNSSSRGREMCDIQKRKLIFVENVSFAEFQALCVCARTGMQRFV